MATHKVKHSGLYLRINGKLEKLPVGYELTLDEEKAKKMVDRGFVEPIVSIPKKIMGKAKKKE